MTTRCMRLEVEGIIYCAVRKTNLREMKKSKWEKKKSPKLDSQKKKTKFMDGQAQTQPQIQVPSWRH